MARKKTRTRSAVALIGAGAVVTATVLPGAISAVAQSGDTYTAVTRAVLAQGDVNGDINRATLVTQIQVDGNGQTSFSVPVPSGGSPKNMDEFGGPNVVDGSAQYNLTVDGPQTIRTQQDFDPNDIPVTMDVSATLNGQPVDPSDLAGADGYASLTYTLNNTTSEPTLVTYEDGAGNTISEEMEIPTPMAAQLSMVFDGSWTEVQSEQADAVAQNGQGGTQVGATVPLMTGQAGAPEQSVTIEGRISNGVVPANQTQIAIIAPLDTQQGKSTAALAEETGTGLTALYAGLEELSGKLGEAVDGSQKIADGVAGTLGPGIAELYEKAVVEGHATAITAARTLVDQARGEAAYQKLLQSFDKINNEGLFVIQDAQIQLANQMGVMFGKAPICSPGDPAPCQPGLPDVRNATAGGTLASLLFGLQKGSYTGGPITKATAGLTNPNCDPDDPQNEDNPCGAVQAMDIMLGKLDFHVPKPCQDALAGCLAANPGASALLQLLDEVMVGPKGYTGTIGADIFQASGLKSLKGDSVVNLIDGMFTTPGCKMGGNLLTGFQPEPLTCISDLGKDVNQGLEITKVYNIAQIAGGFLGSFAGSIGTCTEANAKDCDASTTLRGGISELRYSLVETDSGWPAGCQGPNPSQPAYKDPYGCNFRASGLFDALYKTKGGTTAANIMNTLSMSLTKTGSNPLGQFSPSRDSQLKWSVCAGGEADTDLIKATCSAVQALGFASAGVSGYKRTTISKGVVAPQCPVVASTPWDPPQTASQDGTTPPQPDEQAVTDAGAACAVRTLKNSVDRILLPTIGNGVQQKTLEQIGSGQYTPFCDPNVTGTLTCALSVMDYGVNGPQDESLVNGTATLAAGLPAAPEAINTLMLPPLDDSLIKVNSGVAVAEAMGERAYSGADVPGGAAQGVDSNQGIYAYELAGAGGVASQSGARFLLAILILLVAGGAGWFLASSRNGT